MRRLLVRLGALAGRPGAQLAKAEDLAARGAAWSAFPLFARLLAPAWPRRSGGSATAT